MIFLVLFIFIPIVELYVMLEVGDVVGAFNTVFLVILTALVGGVLVRAQGFSTLMKIREISARGEAPAFEMLEGMVLLMCGAMLLLPGFVTDVIGFLLLIPPVRKLVLINLLKRGNLFRMSPANNDPFSKGPFSSDVPGDADQHSRNISRPKVIDAETWKKED